MQLLALPDDIIAHIMSYVEPGGIIAICGGHIYPLKAIVIACKFHIAPAVVRYMREHPYNNLYLRYSADIFSKLAEPLFASRRRLCMPKTQKPVQICTNAAQLRPLYTYEATSYTTRAMALVDIIAKNTIAAIALQVKCANAILHDCGIKLGLLNGIKTAEHIAQANTTIRLMRITYYNMRDNLAECQCTCGRRLIYQCRTHIDIDVMCAARAPVIMRAHNFTRRLHGRIVRYGRFAGQSFKETYRQIARRRTYSGDMRYNANADTLNNYIAACFVRDAYAPMCPEPIPALVLRQ